jgi:hypothetical protein
MNRKRKVVLSALAMAAVISVSAGEDLACGSLENIFLDTVSTGSPIILTSSSEISALPKVTYMAGDTVTATKYDGTDTLLVEESDSPGAVAFSPDAGGLWRLENAKGETVSFAIPWSVFGDSWTKDSASYSPFVMDTNGEGPNRKVRKGDAPSVAYTCDHWRGDSSAGAILTLIPPNGGSVTEIPLAGSGAAAFDFNVGGVWTVKLAMADETELEARINLTSPRFIMTIR